MHSFPIQILVDSVVQQSRAYVCLRLFVAKFLETFLRTGGKMAWMEECFLPRSRCFVSPLSIIIGINLQFVH
jgi:hypothetical protein